MNQVVKKRIKKIIIFILILAILLGGSVSYYYAFMYPYRATVTNPEPSLLLTEELTREKAVEDLNFLMTHLKNYHPAYLDGSDDLTAALKEQYQVEEQSLQDKTTVLELWQSAERIASKLHDGHTSVNYNNPATDHFISDFSQIMTYGNPTAINGIPIASIFETFKGQYSFETEAYAESIFYHTYIISELYLNYCGIDTTNGVTLTFQTEDGLTDYHYDFVTVDKIENYENEESTEWVSYKIDLENDLAIFTLKKCICNDEYLFVLDQFFKEVHNNKITNIAIDLRGNSGGNSYVANEFLRYLDVDSYNSWDCAVRYGWYLSKNTNIVYKNKKMDPLFDGNVYVLTNVRTYSSAMDFAMLIGDNDLGYIIGKASGNMPNSYGDILTFQLPNSKLLFHISYKKWYRVDKSKADEPLTPDYEVEAAKALDKVYELIEHN